MPVTPEPALLSATVARLRAAGCVFAEDEAELLFGTATSEADLEAKTAQRVSGQPLEHVVGWAEFCGLRILLEPSVFVPRRRTEFLARQALALAPARGAVVVDMCCGTAPVAAVLASELAEAQVHAADIDPAEVRCARRNLEPLGGHVYEGDLFAPLPASLKGRVDVLVANAPYVPSEAIGTMPPEARDYEPLVSLDGGADGLDVQRRVVAEAPAWLASGGHLLIETSDRQAQLTLAAVAAAGLEARIVEFEELDATVVIGRKA